MDVTGDENDLLQHLEGWNFIQDIGQHPLERQGLCFCSRISCRSAFQAESVNLYCSAFDLGLRIDRNSNRFHATQLDVNFINSAQAWQVLESEQIVAEALPRLFCTFDAAVSQDSSTFWHRLSGTWIVVKISISVLIGLINSHSKIAVLIQETLTMQRLDIPAQAKKPQHAELSPAESLTLSTWVQGPVHAVRAANLQGQEISANTAVITTMITALVG